MKKLPLNELEVKSFTTVKASNKIGGSIICPTNFDFCTTGNPLICTQWGGC